MRYLLILFSLCVALATSARAQTDPLTIEIDLISPVQGNLNFNPTAAASPYPFRSVPTNPVAQPATGVQCYDANANNSQGIIPTPDNTSRVPVDPACFKSFPQFFKPLESSLDDNTYVLKVCNLQSAPSRFRVSVLFTAPTPANLDFPVNQLVYRLKSVGNSSTIGNWTNAVSTPAVLYTSTTADRLPAVNNSPAGSNCTTLTVQLRLRLDGGESFLNASLSSDVTFSVAVFP